MADKSQFQEGKHFHTESHQTKLNTDIYQGHMPENQYQDVPGAQHKLDPQPATEMVPTPDGGYKQYQAAGKLKGKKAIITGGDSGIGRATAVLFAMEGADSFIAYLPQEEKDAQETKKQVEAKGAKCHLFATDLTKRENCVKTVEEAIKALGGLDILFNNHAFQMVQEDILSLPDEQWLKTFDTNIHRTSNPHHYLPNALD